MKIAYLGWGSLIWDKSGEFPIENNKWYNDGPYIPIEFKRVSKDKRLTLIVDPNGPNIKNVQSLYAFAITDDFEESINILARKEKLSKTKAIHFINIKDKLKKCPPEIFNNILNWMLKKQIDIVIWTGLQKNFENQTGMKYNLENAKKHIAKYFYQNDKIKEYIIKTPKQIQTNLRQKLEEFVNNQTMIDMYNQKYK